MIEATDIWKSYPRSTPATGDRRGFGGFLMRKYDLVPAVRGVTLSIAPGELVGFIGPNGAGKSTTLKMITGILQPDAGSVRVGGLCPIASRKDVAKRLGIVFGQRSQLLWDLPLRYSINFIRRIYGLSADDCAKSLQAMARFMEIGSLMEIPVRQLSLGQRMRAELVAAFLHAPPILILDEPTIGLDSDAKHSLREFVKAANHELNVTVVLTTHDISDILAVCQRVVVINSGTIVQDGKVRDVLLSRSAIHRIAVQFDGAVPDFSGSGVRAEKEDQKIILSLTGTRAEANEFIAHLFRKYNVREAEYRAPDIDDIVRDIYAQTSGPI